MLVSVAAGVTTISQYNKSGDVSHLSHRFRFVSFIIVISSLTQGIIF